MADNETLSDGFGGTITVSMDEAASGQVQRVKLAYSGDGLDTHIPADASGLLVNLGTNNDITLTSGTLTAIAGTVTATIAGTPSVALASGTATFTLGSGAYVGLSTNGTAIADILSLTNGTALAVGLYDSDGDQLGFPSAAVLTATPTLDAATYTANDSLHDTIMSFANAVATSGGTGAVVKLEVVDNDDQGIEGELWLFKSSVTVAAAQDPFALSDGDLDEVVAVIPFGNTTDAGKYSPYYDAVNGRIAINDRIRVAYNCDATTLYGQLKTLGTPTYTASGLEVILHVIRD